MDNASAKAEEKIEDQAGRENQFHVQLPEGYTEAAVVPHQGAKPSRIPDQG